MTDLFTVSAGSAECGGELGKKEHMARRTNGEENVSIKA